MPHYPIIAPFESLSKGAYRFTDWGREYGEREITGLLFLLEKDFSMPITIKNDSVSAFVYGYACTPSGQIIWLDLAPQHVKVVGAIRAELTSNTRRYLRISDPDSGRNLSVYGLGHGYLNLTADAPHLAVGPRAKAQMLRMIAPEAVQPENVQDEFYVLAWEQSGITPATALAAVLERYSHFPMQIAWGKFLLATAIQDHNSASLLSGGTVPDGFVFPANTPWGAIISQGLSDKKISFENCFDQK